uniref:Uncharacterized protein n=1 Tax=Arundo donax TaxID=35708 RepID=A0A0A8XTI5_ARUDO
MPDLLPMAIVLAMGGAAAGGPEALGFLLAVAGRSAIADVIICAFLICAFTAFVLGILLLARFFRVARNAVAPAPAQAADPFAAMTLAVALAAVFFVTASLIAAPSIPAGRGRGSAAPSCSA